jgi:sulfonate transport system substrate-binding protein
LFLQLTKETPLNASTIRRQLSIFSAVLLTLVAVGCRRSGTEKLQVIRLDYAYYSPVSLVLKQQHIVEDDFARDGVKVEWAQSLGSNKALELLNSKSVDFGSTAGAAALIGRANGNPIKTIYVSSRPEWTALVTLKVSPIQKVQDLKGKKIAVTRGTDPYVFLLRALYGAGLSEKDVELVPLQHPDGRNALERGDVDAWAGLDPMMAATEIDKGSRLFFRDVNLNSYSVLNVREEFAQQHPDYVKRVLADYEKARNWAIGHPEELRRLFAEQTKLNEAVAARVLERYDFSNSTIGDAQKKVIASSGDVLKKAGVIPASIDIDTTLNQLIDPQYLQAQTASVR